MFLGNAAASGQAQSGSFATGQSVPKPAPSPESTQDKLPTFVLKEFVPGQPLRLVAYGDMRFTDPSVTSGTNPRVRKWLVDKIALEHPQALLLTGDMPFAGSRTADWEDYRRETASWHTEGFPIFPTLGNHEVYYDAPSGVQNYLDNFPNIERHRFYSAVLGSVEVLSLDMNLPVGPRTEQGRWFNAQLEHVPPAILFLLILYHVPWVADTQSQLVANLPSKGALALRNVLEAHLSRMHAKVLVFNGHIHNYERFERHGVEYIVTGGGGAQPYPILFRGSHDLYRDSGFPVYHYLTLEVRDNQLTGTMWKVIDPDAPVLNVEAKDRFTIAANPILPFKSSNGHKPGKPKQASP
jgi:hypothetical protein